MIVKTLDPLTSTDPLRQAGHQAEAQLAFYLQRAFGSDPTLRVLNGLRLEHEGDAAQIDHLILYPYGLIVVESKSVTGSIRVNDQGEWTRLYRGRAQGMPSPKLQAERQATFLRRYLAAHTERLLEGPTRGRPGFERLPIDLLVAVSDGGVIERPQAHPLDDLYKADQIPERIHELVAQRTPAGGLKGLFHQGFRLREPELAGLAAFLRCRHTPLQRATSPAPRPAAAVENAPLPPSPPAASPAAASPLPPAPTPAAYSCKHCQGERLEIRFGKFSYYFKCLDCGGNTAIARPCSGCGGKERVRKQRADFYGECAACGTSVRFYQNVTTA